MHLCFLNFFVGLLKKIPNTKILLDYIFLKHLPKAASEFFSDLLSLSLVSFLHVITSHWTYEKSAYIYMPWVVYGTILSRVPVQVLQ
jgi:hypothetical protein